MAVIDTSAIDTSGIGASGIGASGADHGYELADRYRRDDGRVFLSGSQALARLPLEQLRADRRAGRNVAAYITGYPGSPLANYDRDVAAAAAVAAADGLTMLAQPALNEELAATAVMGSQLTVTLDTARFEGVLGIWYGKAPGLDRASDAIRHAVFAGASATGGAVALVGDDSAAKSSTLPSSSGSTLIDLNIPILYPGDVQEALDLGRHAIALSRASGLWTSIKVVEAVADGTGTVELHADRITPIIPHVEVGGKPFTPMPSGRLLTPFTLDMEREFHEVRLELARMYAAENHLNTIDVRGPQDWIGIAACGHTYREVREALRLLGLGTDQALRDAGVRLLKLSVPMPLDGALVGEFGDGLAEVMVIEEKTPSLELFVKDALYPLAQRPVVTGKRQPDGRPLVSMTGALLADNIAPALRSRLSARLADRLAPPPQAPRTMIPLTVNRTPYFCSGCPHNSSTKVPEGALVGGGIGCHAMVMLMEPARAGHIVGLTAMGNEGAQWLGMAPFVTDNHLIQNLGDGTLFHSGILAVRAASASGLNITYKILYNGAVAMTGGQDAYGQLSVPDLTRALLAEGVRRVLITTDELDNYRAVQLPPGVEVWGRQRLIEAQELLAAVPGCTVLIHDQRCAAEKRRDLKRGKIAAPAFRVVINERVCEGCGDCGDVSNCLSVQPVDTAFGRKTKIDQHSCNFDLSCMQGDCPSFMTVSIDETPPAVRTATLASPASIPLPNTPDLGDGYTVRLSGVGGTGVVTVSQILGTAAMLDGRQVRGLDQTGLSQKAGPVVSDVRITDDAPQSSNRATNGSVDLLIAFDQLVAGSDAQLTGSSPERTVVVASSSITPTGSMVIHPDLGYPVDQVTQRLDVQSRAHHRVDSLRVIHGLLGDDATANVFMLGVATQLGLVPIQPTSIERAISLNGVAVDKNLSAFAWGRQWVCDPSGTEAAAGLQVVADDTPLMVRLTVDLVGYQSAAYARRFTDIVGRVEAAGHPELTDTVARNLHKLMAYKDEYEVARLLLLPEARAAAEAVGGAKTKVTWHLHPPTLRAMGMGRKLKLRYSGRPTMRVLRTLKRLRGTPLDVFGMTELRRKERALVPEYVAAVEHLLASVTQDNLSEAVAIAGLPDRVRGYEHLKMERATAYQAELARRLAAFSPA